MKSIAESGVEPVIECVYFMRHETKVLLARERGSKLQHI